MSDESVLSVSGLGRLEYTCKYYMAYAERVQEKAKELTKIGILIMLRFNIDFVF